MTTSRWRILQPDNRSPYLSPHTTSPCVHTSFSLSCKSAAQEAVCPFTTCSSASRLWSSSGASKIHTLSFLPGISVPWPRHSSSYIFSSIWHLCNFSISIFKEKKKWNHSDSIILSHLPPPQPQITPPKPRCAVNAILAFHVCLPGPTVSILCLRFWSDFTALPSCLPIFICLLFIYFLFLVLSNA